MENLDRDKQAQILRKRVHGLPIKSNRKSQAAWESLPKRTLAHIPIKTEKPAILSPNSIAQQAFRNYSVRGIPKGSSEVMINKMNHLKNLSSQGSNKPNFRTIMTSSNVSSANGLKSMSTEPSHNAQQKATRQLLMNNPQANIYDNKHAKLELENTHLPGKGRMTSFSKQQRKRGGLQIFEQDNKPQSVKGSRVFSMLQSLDLQQYSRKFIELGFDNDLWKLTFLNKRQRKDFIQNLKPLPGHKDKLDSMFSMLDDIFDKEGVSQIIRHTSSGKRSRQQWNTQSGHQKDLNKSNQNRKSSANADFQKEESETQPQSVNLRK